MILEDTNAKDEVEYSFQFSLHGELCQAGHTLVLVAFVYLFEWVLLSCLLSVIMLVLYMLTMKECVFFVSPLQMVLFIYLVIFAWTLGSWGHYRCRQNYSRCHT